MPRSRHSIRFSEVFFAGTESDFVNAVKAVAVGGGGEVEQNWLSTLRRMALSAVRPADHPRTY